jgi:hypothetical protein
MSISTAPSRIALLQAEAIRTFDFAPIASIQAKSAKRGRSVSIGAAIVSTCLAPVSPSVAGAVVTLSDPLFSEQAQAQTVITVPTDIYQTVCYYGGAPCSSAQAETNAHEPPKSPEPNR